MVEEDPPPTPPIEPQAGDCCGGGCVPCVYEIYEMELERYEAAMQKWQQRQKLKEMK